MIEHDLSISEKLKNEPNPSNLAECLKLYVKLFDTEKDLMEDIHNLTFQTVQEVVEFGGELNISPWKPKEICLEKALIEAADVIISLFRWYLPIASTLDFSKISIPYIPCLSSLDEEQQKIKLYLNPSMCGYACNIINTLCLGLGQAVHTGQMTTLNDDDEPVVVDIDVLDQLLKTTHVSYSILLDLFEIDEAYFCNLIVSKILFVRCRIVNGLYREGYAEFKNKTNIDELVMSNLQGTPLEIYSTLLEAFDR